MSERLEPYDQGYRDGWHDIHVSPVARRKRRRAKDEYALGYGHGRIDGATWGQFEEWSDYRDAPAILEEPRPIVWRRAGSRFVRASGPPMAQDAPLDLGLAS